MHCCAKPFVVLSAKVPTSVTRSPRLRRGRKSFSEQLGPKENVSIELINEGRVAARISRCLLRLGWFVLRSLGAKQVPRRGSIAKHTTLGALLSYLAGPGGEPESGRRGLSTTESLSFLPTWAKGIALILSLILSAGLTAVSAASPDFGWIAWVSLLPLFVAIRFLTPRRALACGSLWGLALYGVSLLGTQTITFPSIGSLALAATAPAAYALLGALLARRIGFAPLFLGLGWIGVESALSPLGMGHGLLAASQESGWVMNLLANSLGYGLVAFLVVFFNASLFVLLTRVPWRFNGTGPRVWWQALQLRWSSQTSVAMVGHGLVSAQPRAPPRRA